MDELKPGGEIPEKFKTWLQADQAHVNKWRKEAKIDFDFRDGDQWSDDDRDYLDDLERPAITMNRCMVVVDAICGAEIANRQEVRYVPRETSQQKQQRQQGLAQMAQGAMNGAAPGAMPQAQQPQLPAFSKDVKASELYTEAARWFRDRADADENDTEAFRDAVTCGIGCTETRLDYEENPDGELRDDHTDIFEMLWDANARKRNLRDASRVWHVKKVPIADARALVGEDFTDEQLNAEWAEKAIWTGDNDQHSSEPVRDRTGPGDMSVNPEDGLKEVVLVRCMWIEREPVWRIVTPESGSVNMTEADFENLDSEVVKALKESAVRQTRKVRKQAWLGSVVLKAMPTPCPTQFPFQFITAKRHQTKRMWYGVVRPMRDPQQWSNKFFSQILDIINSSAKGGIMAERGTMFENDNEAEETWTSARDITWAKAGALSGANPKWMPKPQATVPQGLQYLMEVATQSTQQVVGASPEMLGMREANQPGILEYQRRQSGMMILQPFFDSLKSYRMNQGELILWFIQNDLSDERLIRITGDDDAPYVPLIKDTTLEYDLIIDDMPTSPNQKEATWQVAQVLLPILQATAPALIPELIKTAPGIPSSFIAKWDQMLEQQNSGPIAQLQQAVQQLQIQMAQAKLANEQAKAGKTQVEAQTMMAEAQAKGQMMPLDAAEKQADTFKTQAEGMKVMQEVQAGPDREDPNVKMQLAMRQQDLGAANQRHRIEGDLAIRAANFAADNERADRKQALDMQIDSEAFNNDAQLKTWKAGEEVRIRREAAENKEDKS